MTYPHMSITGGTPPQEPSADARALARTVRDQYVALRAEGFTEPQALSILGSMLAAAVYRQGDADGN